MKPITSEDKARYFSGYLKQKVSDSQINGTLYGVRITPDTDHWWIDLGAMPFHIKRFWLLLRPISSLNDEEAIHIALLLKVNFQPSDDAFHFDLEGLKGYLEDDVMSGIIPINLACWQYLQSIGIALPFYCNGQTYSVSDLVEAAIVKLIE